MIILFIKTSIKFIFIIIRLKTNYTCFLPHRHRILILPPPLSMRGALGTAGIKAWLKPLSIKFKLKVYFAGPFVC